MILPNGTNDIFKLCPGRWTGMQDIFGQKLHEGDIVTSRNFPPPGDKLEYEIRFALFGRRGVRWALVYPGADYPAVGLPEGSTSDQEYGVELVRKFDAPKPNV